MNPRPELASGPARILIVDDDRAQRELLQTMLGPEGFVFVMAGSGEEALELAGGQPLDLILLDIIMPGLDGYQVAAKLKADPATRHIPIVVVTDVNAPKDRMLGLEAGVDDFLAKPVNRAELRVRVKNLLRLKAYGDYHDRYSQLLEAEVKARSAELVDSERLYRSTFDEAPVGIVHVDLEGRWLRVNQRLCELLGYSPDELRSRELQSVMHLAAPAGEAEALQQMLAGTLEHWVVDGKPYQRRDGSPLWARVSTSLHRDGAGRPQHFVSVVEDITARRALEAEVRQSLERLTISETRYRTLLDVARDAIAILTPEGVVREMNQRWETITGLPRAQLIGRHLREFAPAGKADGNFQSFKIGATGANTNVIREPVSIATADGSTLYMEFSHALTDVGGERLVLAIGRDVTEKRLLEEQLRQAQKLETIGQLAGGIAHDFNNLLTAILGFSDLAASAMAPDHEAQADVLEIKNAGQRAAGLTRQLLAFSRKQILQPSVLRINEIVSAMEPLLKRLIFEHVNLVVSLPADIGAVNIDPTQLEQIIVNLTVNAADAMPRGGRLTVETANVTLDEAYRHHHLSVKPGDYVMLAVSDTGVGMDEATSARVFEPFFSTKGVGKGTGLGLATVYGIVKQSGGDIWVYSEPGRGSTFKIYLPRVTEALQEVKLARAPGELTPGTETVLLVEDDEAVRRLTRMVLQRAGYHVIEAEDPREALRLASDLAGGTVIELLLSDVIMPNSEGPPLFASLVKLQPAIRVLYMSGYADEAVVRQGVVLEGTPFLQKPFTPLALAQKVRDVLDAVPAAPLPPSATIGRGR